METIKDLYQTAVTACAKSLTLGRGSRWRNRPRQRGAVSYRWESGTSLGFSNYTALDQRLRAISIAAKPRPTIVINITVLAGMCVRKSIISLHRYSHADARKKNIAICEHVPTRSRKGGAAICAWSQGEAAPTPQRRSRFFLFDQNV